MKRILVIDDDLQVRQMLRQMLEREGYEVVEAKDGKEGYELYHQAPTDLVITDIIMPKGGGLEVIFELRREFPDVKIIAISGGGRFLSDKDCLSLCGDRNIPAISKPFERKEILKAIEGLLGNGRSPTLGSFLRT